MKFTSPNEASIDLNAEILITIRWRDEWNYLIQASVLRKKEELIYLQTINGVWSKAEPEGEQKLKDAYFHTTGKHL